MLRIGRMVAAACVVLATVGCRDHHLGAVVVNQTSEPLASVELTVAGKRLPDITDVPVGGSVTVRPRTTVPDGVWSARVRLASGKELSADAGDATNGMSLTQTIIVSDEGIRNGGVEIVGHESEASP